MPGKIRKLLRAFAAPRRGAATGLASDGLPLPPPGLIEAVAGTPDPVWFLEGGRLGVQTITTMLARRGITFHELSCVLDFGCGCGRVLRHLRDHSAAGPGPRLHGTDYNRELVSWCRRHLPFAQTGTNRLSPPTRYEEATFDFIFAFSVFTHLTEDLQHAWMGELRRILRADGLLLITVHGDRYLETLGEADRVRYHAGDTVVWSGRSAGRNRCAAFHSERCVREKLAAASGFEVLAFVPEGALGNPHQDAYLLAPSE